MRSSRKRSSTNAEPLRVAGVLVVVAFLLCALAIVARFLISAQLHATYSSQFQPSSTVNPIEAIALETYLSANLDALSQSASSRSDKVVVSISPGDTAATVSDTLAASGVIHDPSLLRAFLRYYGLDTRLEAGEYHVAANMTIPEIAASLTDPALQDITFRIPEGWRREEIAQWIGTQSNLPFTAQDFLTATDGSLFEGQVPSIANEIPQGMSLEGWLYPDTYRIARDSRASDVVNKSLSNLESKLTPELRNGVAARNLTIYQVITLASIVEREAVVDRERELIASVYLNRLSQGMKLDADPTVQYALGFQPDTGLWWKRDLTLDHYQSVLSPYNTYLNFGLPPGPIANPSIRSITAVIFPAQSTFLFFRAKCDGSGEHYFSESYEEHLAYACP